LLPFICAIKIGSRQFDIGRFIVFEIGIELRHLDFFLGVHQAAIFFSLFSFLEVKHIFKRKVALQHFNFTFDVGWDSL